MNMGQRGIGIGIPVQGCIECNRCANSRPGRLGVLEMTQVDGPGFSLCAAPLESSGPVF